MHSRLSDTYLPEFMWRKEFDGPFKNAFVNIISHINFVSSILCDVLVMSCICTVMYYFCAVLLVMLCICTVVNYFCTLYFCILHLSDIEGRIASKCGLRPRAVLLRCVSLWTVL